MNKFLFCCGLFLVYVSHSIYAIEQVPQTPIKWPQATAKAYIDKYKSETNNLFAQGYLLDINKVVGMSTVGAKVYNGLTGNAQKMVVSPLKANFVVNTTAPSYVYSDARLCPRYCDVTSMEAGVNMSNAEITGCVNNCVESRMYEPVNAFIVFTPPLAALAAAGFKYVRMYNGIDHMNKRCIVYVPVDASGKDVMLEELYVADASSVCTNCSYP